MSLIDLHLKAPTPLSAGHAHQPALGRVTAVRTTQRHLWCWTVASWLLCLPVALALPGIVGLSPLTLRGSTPPLLVGVAGLGIGVLVALRRRSAVLPHIAAGLFAGWIVLDMHTALHGTPYGFGGLTGDMGRVTAMANRYSHTMRSSDGIVGHVPSDYPPLFPWLVGRASALSGVPAWRLMGVSETLLTSMAIVVPFLLWRRLLPAGVALVVTVVCFAVFVSPEKPYEVLALGLVIPWTLGTFANPPRGRMHWLPAGIIGGLQVVLYQGYVMFAALGILAIVATTLRRPPRAAYARHVVGVVVSAFIVSSWYLVPYLAWSFTHGLEMTDRFQDAAIGANPFPFLTLTPAGALCAVGVVGLIHYRRGAWWAAPIATVTVGTYVYRFVSELGYVADGQTGVFQYTSSAIVGTLAIAGALTLWWSLPGVLRRLSLAAPSPNLRLCVITALLAGVGIGIWHASMPGAPAGADDQLSLTGQDTEATQAFLQALPDGRYVRLAPSTGRPSAFPVDEIVRDVDSVRGTGGAPPVLSVSEELFDFRAWPGYLGVGANAAAATSEWYSRLAALHALSELRSPTAFASASAHTRFGAIDVFVLDRDGSSWDWQAMNYPALVRFHASQFAPSAFSVFRDLPDGLVLAVRR